MSLPLAQKEISLYQDKLREAKREIEVKDVEIKVLTNKYNGVREDLSSLQISKMGQVKNEGDFEQLAKD